MRVIRTCGLVLLCCGGLLAAPAHATNRIEGTWYFGVGLVEITPAGSPNVFKGTVYRRMQFSYCPHLPGERMWEIKPAESGIYRGTHINYFRKDCSRDPGAPSIWRVRKVEGTDILDFCSNDPGQPPPTEFNDRCVPLRRAAPARDLSRVCSSGPVARTSGSRADKAVCVEGPAALRRNGCVSRRGRIVHRFNVKLRTKGTKARRGRLYDSRAKITYVRFKLDRRSKGTDRRSPFQLALKGKQLKKGTHVLLADVVLQTPGSKKRQRQQMAFRFDAC